ncbi:DUF4148 domain-containing protein [Caballeronia sp. DA-9]|uniref:DUF4148 domain-containing protein n=1 Tax=Caballeronia sp. DA-9 TaxID=3436237 RepID=UPI003F68017E
MTEITVKKSAVLLRIGFAGWLAAAAISQPVCAQSSEASTPQTRKAERKATRAKNRAEMGTLEQNGYRPGADLNYPSNLEDAERKAQNSTGKGAIPRPASH